MFRYSLQAVVGRIGIVADVGSFQAVVELPSQQTDQKQVEDPPRRLLLAQGPQHDQARQEEQGGPTGWFAQRTRSIGSEQHPGQDWISGPDRNGGHHRNLNDLRAAQTEVVCTGLYIVYGIEMSKQLSMTTF